MTLQRRVGDGSPSGRSSTARRCCSNWLVTAPSMLQWPVLCGRIASSLTSSRPSVVSNSSTASTPVTSSSSAIVVASARASAASAPGLRCRSDDFRAHPVALHRLDEHPRGGLPRGSPCDELREFAAEVDEFFGEQRPGGEPVVGLPRGSHHANAFAVVAAAGSLHDRRAAVRRQEGTEFGRVADDRPGRNGDPEGGEPLAHHDLVLRDGERRGTGSRGNAGGDERGRARPGARARGRR